MTIEWTYILRLFIAGLLGGLIGLEREFRAKEAGVRTHFIVALGSALFMLISQYAFEAPFDHSRVAAQVVSGIGFIGAGVIIFQKNVVRGVTTAAGLWVAAAIGLAAGAGMYDISVAATLMAILCLETMHFFTYRYGEKILSVTYEEVNGEDFLVIMDGLKAAGLNIESFSLDEGKANFQVRCRPKAYDKTIRTILSAAKGTRVEIL